MILTLCCPADNLSQRGCPLVKLGCHCEALAEAIQPLDYCLACMYDRQYPSPLPLSPCGRGDRIFPTCKGGIKGKFLPPFVREVAR